MRLVSWNVNSLRARSGRISEFLAYCDADIICLQETKLVAGKPGLQGNELLSEGQMGEFAEFEALGYEFIDCRQESGKGVAKGAWNGVAIGSRVGITNSVYGFSQAEIEQVTTDPYEAAILSEARIISAQSAGVGVTSVYVPNGRSLDDPHFGAKMAWLSALRNRMANSVEDSKAGDSKAGGSKAGGPKINVVCGDFNIAPTDQDVYDVSDFSNSTHVSAAERDALCSLVATGHVDLFRQLYDSSELYSYWDYRAGMFHKNNGMRIDLALGDSGASKALRWAGMDRNARREKLASDHAPIIFDFDLSEL